MAMASRPPQAVFLVGFMGAGKTSVGKALAQRLRWFFLDLDSEIEHQPVTEPGEACICLAALDAPLRFPATSPDAIASSFTRSSVS